MSSTAFAAPEQRTSALIKVTLPLPAGEWHGFAVETVWARPTESLGVVSLENTPFFAKGLSYLDLVEVAAGDSGDEIVLQRVVKKMGHSTYRVIPADAKSATFESFLAALTPLRCTYESAVFGNVGIYAIEVPDAEAARQLYTQLEAGELAGTFEFEEGDYNA